MVERWPFVTLFVLVASSLGYCFGVAVLHTDGNRTGVTVHLPEVTSRFYFPGITRLLQPCTTLQTNECPYLALDILMNKLEGRSNTVIIAKFVDAIGFMELQWLGDGGSVTDVASVVMPITQHGMSDPCNLLDVVNQGGYWVVYCIVQSRHVFICDMMVNFTKYSHTELRCRYVDDSDIQEPSNFQYIPSNGNVFFTDRNVLYRINPSDDSLEDFADLSSSSCRDINYIPHNDNLLLYCGMNEAIEVGFDQIKHKHILNETGVAYVCKESEQFIVVRQRSSSVEIIFNNQSVTLNVTSFVDVKCIMERNRALIFIVDEYAHVIMLNAASLAVRNVPVECSVASPCRKIHLLTQPTGFLAIILKEFSRHTNVWVFDQNLRNILSFEQRDPFGGFASLYSPLNDGLSSMTSKSSNDVYSTKTEMNNMPENGNNKNVVEKFPVSALVPTICSALVVIALIATFIIYLVVRAVRGRKKAETLSPTSSSTNVSRDNMLDSNSPGLSQGSQNQNGLPPSCQATGNVPSGDLSSVSPINLPLSQGGQSSAVAAPSVMLSGITASQAQEHVDNPATGNRTEMSSYAMGEYERERYSFYGCNLEINTAPQEVVDGASIRTSSQVTSVL